MPSLPLDDENLPLFTVGQVSQMLEIQQAFLRRLDRLGVVSPDRSEGNQRRYTRREVTVVRYVVDLVDEGMTLAAVRRVLELEAIVHDLMAERDALRAAVAERDARLAEGDARLAERNARLAERDAQLARLSAEPPGRRGSAPSPEPRGR
jgi:MerR family transcriptional regulator/heat shock protein HspR